ncbi:MAG: hypothetical protein AAGB24_03385 [Bacteroidota bacterium]
MKHRFSGTSVFQFIRRDLILHKATLVTGLLVALVLLFLFCWLNMLWDQQLATSEFFGIFGLFYVPLGILFTFSLTKEFNNPKANHLFLVLPVSVFERLCAQWITTTVLYTAVFSILALAVGTLAIIMGIITFRADFNLLSLFSAPYWKVVQLYFIIQPVFLVGALTYSKNRIGKTALALGILFLALLFFNFILYALFNHGYGIFKGESLGSDAFDLASADFSLLGKWFYGLVFGPLMLVVAYLKMAEKEV